MKPLTILLLAGLLAGCAAPTTKEQTHTTTTVIDQQMTVGTDQDIKGK
jgi:uncharacterized lipoprotein YajG